MIERPDLRAGSGSGGAARPQALLDGVQGRVEISPIMGFSGEHESSLGWRYSGQTLVSGQAAKRLMVQMRVDPVAEPQQGVSNRGRHAPFGKPHCNTPIS